MITHAVCDWCGKSFTRKENDRKRKHHFCSRDCFDQARFRHMPGLLFSGEGE